MPNFYLTIYFFKNSLRLKSKFWLTLGDKNMFHAGQNKNQKLKLSHSMTHYLLVIHHLKESKGYARVTDISKELKITKGSVSTAVNGLKEKGLVQEEEGNKFLMLSERGHEEVHYILTSRVLLYSFFKDFLKVDESSSREGSCLMEHLVGSEIREKFFYFMKTISLSDKDRKKKKLLSDMQAFETDLNLPQYKSLSDFVQSQNSSF